MADGGFVGDRNLYRHFLPTEKTVREIVAKLRQLPEARWSSPLLSASDLAKRGGKPVLFERIFGL